MNSQELPEDQRNLSGALRALAAHTAGAQAPERVESALRSAFRAHTELAYGRAFLAVQAGKHRWPRRTLALAATLFVLAGITAAWLGRPRVQPPRAVPVQAPRPPQVKTEAPPLLARQARRAARPRVRPKPAAPPAAKEVATGFFPLDEASSLSPIESAQVVRVRVPRATLARFGLPVNQDRISEPVKADVVFAQDGIARAIRFVK